MFIDNFINIFLMYEISNVYKKMQILCKRVDFSEASYS